MYRSEKVTAVAEIEEIFRNNNSVIITHYHGLTVSDISKLRKELQEQCSGFKVIKNTLAKIAAKNIGITDADSLFVGPVGISYSKDPVGSAKAIANYAKAKGALKIVGGILDNNIVDSNVINTLSKLPSMNELRGKIVSVLQAPARNIACIAKAPAEQLARVIGAYANK